MCHSAAFPDSWYGANALLYLHKGLHDVVAGQYPLVPSAPGAVTQSTHRPCVPQRMCVSVLSFSKYFGDAPAGLCFGHAGGLSAQEDHTYKEPLLNCRGCA